MTKKKTNQKSARVKNADRSIADAMKKIRRDDKKHNLTVLILQCVAEDDWALAEFVAHRYGKLVDAKKRAVGVVDLDRVRKLRFLERP